MQINSCFLFKKGPFLRAPFFIIVPILFFWNFALGQESPSTQPSSEASSSEPTFVSLDDKKSSKFGIGLGFGWLYDYPGARRSRLHFLPFPIYRGDRFRMDRLDGISGRVANSRSWKFSWSFVFQFPTESEDILIRKDMADLDWLLSIGPMIEWTLYQNKDDRLFLRLPIRANGCTNFGDQTRYCGLSFNPGLRWSHNTESLGNLTLRWEAFIDTKAYNDYYYSVLPSEATASRPFYDAQAGFLGFVWGVIHTIPFDGWEVVTAINYYDYGLSENRSSPLFITPTNSSIFIAITIDF